jgi:protein-tyrosine kinase
MGLLIKAFEKFFPRERQSPKTVPNQHESIISTKAAVLEIERKKKENTEDYPYDNYLWDPRLRLSTDPQTPFFESFRRLRVSILYPTSNPQPKTLLVTSTVPNEGKGFICANLGIALSQDMEHHALIVDTDFRRPSMAQLFGRSNEIGLIDHLQDNVDLSVLIQKTGQPKLSILPCGKPPLNPSELIGSSRMASFVFELKERYQDRIIIFDSPPSIVASETSVLAKQLDGVILVIRHGAAKKEIVKDCVDTLGHEKIIAIIYNAYPENKIEAFLNNKMKYGYYHYY